MSPIHTHDSSFVLSIAMGMSKFYTETPVETNPKISCIRACCNDPSVPQLGPQCSTRSVPSLLSHLHVVDKADGKASTSPSVHPDLCSWLSLPCGMGPPRQPQSVSTLSALDPIKITVLPMKCADSLAMDSDFNSNFPWVPQTKIMMVLIEPCFSSIAKMPNWALYLHR